MAYPCKTDGASSKSKRRNRNPEQDKIKNKQLINLEINYAPSNTSSGSSSRLTTPALRLKSPEDAKKSLEAMVQESKEAIIKRISTTSSFASSSSFDTYERINMFNRIGATKVKVRTIEYKNRQQTQVFTPIEIIEGKTSYDGIGNFVDPENADCMRPLASFNFNVTNALKMSNQIYSLSNIAYSLFKHSGRYQSGLPEIIEPEKRTEYQAFYDRNQRSWNGLKLSEEEATALNNMAVQILEAIISNPIELVYEGSAGGNAKGSIHSDYPRVCLIADASIIRPTLQRLDRKMQTYNSNKIGLYYKEDGDFQFFID
jgi:hypothetical protein